MNRVVADAVINTMKEPVQPQRGAAPLHQTKSYIATVEQRVGP
jgi:hypothetical protein